MVDEDEEVADRLRDVVRRVGAVLPVRFADQQNDARRDADEERKRDAEAHERRLTEATAGSCTRRSISGSGSGAVGDRHGPIAHPLSSDQSADDRTVKDEDQNERDGHDQRQYEPRPHVVEEELVLSLRAADATKLPRLPVLGSTRPELVKILDQRQEQDSGRRDDGSLPSTDPRLTQRKTHCHEPDNSINQSINLYSDQINTVNVLQSAHQVEHDFQGQHMRH